MIIKCSSELYTFIVNSIERLQSDVERKRYYHTLCVNDNKPKVVHNRTDQITIVIDGDGKVWLNGVEEYLCRGDIVFISAGTVHSFWTGSSLTLFHIHIPDKGRDQDRIVLDGEDYNRFTI